MISATAGPIITSCVERCQYAPKGVGFRVEFIPHAATIIGIGLCLGGWALLAWAELRKCECQKDRGTFLKPRWKRYGKRK